MRRGLGWGARWMGGVMAVAVLTHCGTGESGPEENRSEAPTSRVEQAVLSTLTFTPSADAVARADAPDQNFGGGDTLSVDLSPEERGYLRFNLTGVTGTVTQARLRLYVTGSTVDGPRLYATRNWDWQDSTLTWYRSPYASEQQLLGDKAALSSGTWVDFDVSAAVHGNGDYTFILEASSTDGVDFASRENSRADRRPQLVLTVDSEPNCLPRVYTRTHTEQPYGDTYVSEAQPTQRFGSESVLRVDSSPARLESYLFFANELIYDLDVWNVKRATVRLFATDGTSKGPRVLATQGGWVAPPYDFDWNTRPTVVGAPLADLGAISANTWVEADVTSTASQRGALFYGLLPDSGDGVDFVSANAAAAERRPQLRVELESGPYCTYRGMAGGRAGYARHYGGAGNEQLMALDTDPQGGFVAAGQFGDAPFPNQTGFALARYDATGSPRWTRQVTTADVRPQALTVTPEGNILVVGLYTGAPNLGTGALPAVPVSWAVGTFIAKFSPSGQIVWSHGFVATYFYAPDQQLEYWPIQAAAVATDAQGSLIVTGNFHGEVDFGGGVLFAGLNSVYSEDAYPGSFIAKFDWQGQHVWSRATQGAPSEPAARTRAVSTDNAGNVFVAGRANSGADLGDGQPLVGSAPYLAKYDGTTGALQWKRVFQGPSWVYGEVTAVQPLRNGDVAFAANLGNTFSFGGGTYTGGTPFDQGYPGNLNGFVGTLSATGGDKVLRDLKGTRLQELVTANDSTFAVSGFGTNVDLGGGVVGPEERIESSAFVARYSATGAHLWSRSLAWSFTGDYYNRRMHMVPVGLTGVLLGGDFAQPFQHDGVTYTPRGASDLFYLRLD